MEDRAVARTNEGELDLVGPRSPGGAIVVELRRRGRESEGPGVPAGAHHRGTVGIAHVHQGNPVDNDEEVLERDVAGDGQLQIIVGPDDDVREDRIHPDHFRIDPEVGLVPRIREGLSVLVERRRVHRVSRDAGDVVLSVRETGEARVQTEALTESSSPGNGQSSDCGPNRSEAALVTPAVFFVGHVLVRGAERDGNVHASSRRDDAGSLADDLAFTIHEGDTSLDVFIRSVGDLGHFVGSRSSDLVADTHADRGAGQVLVELSPSGGGFGLTGAAHGHEAHAEERDQKNEKVLHD